MRSIIKPITSIILFLLFGLVNTYAQTDTEFWFAVPQLNHVHGTPAEQVGWTKNAYFRISTYNQGAQVTIEQPAGGGFTTNMYQPIVFILLM